MDKGAVLFDPLAALEGGTRPVFTCTSCMHAMERAYPTYGSKELSEFFGIIAK